MTKDDAFSYGTTFEEKQFFSAVLSKVVVLETERFSYALLKFGYLLFRKCFIFIH